MSQLASLSLDLDNKWSYMKTHGDAGWESFPSYLDTICPRIVDCLKQLDLTITFFVVGQDAALDKNREALQCLAEAGHEIGNHSFHHEPWLHLYSEQEVTDELQRAEEAIFEATGQKTIGFRGPGFSVSPTVISVLDRMGYVYDASTFPTFLGPVARAYYFMTADMDKEERKKRDKLFGKFSEGFRTLRPYRLPGENTKMLEIPVTTMPVFKLPIHMSYVMYLAQFSKALARTYFGMAMTMCKIARVEPSLLLHPLDFMGADDESDLSFFPAMGMNSEAKVALAMEILHKFKSQFEVTTMLEHAKYHGGKAPPADQNSAEHPNEGVDHSLVASTDIE